MAAPNLQIIKRYLDYILFAVDEHSLHSPFLYQFYINCVRDQPDQKFKSIEDLRKRLLQNDEVIEINDFGAGSKVLNSNKRKIKDIVSASAGSAKFGRFMARMCSYFLPKTIIELGTSLGIMSLYMSLAANNNKKLITFEGCPNLILQANRHFEEFNIKDITVIAGDINQTLPGFLATTDVLDLVYFDANHQYLPTLQYFEWCLQKKNEKSVFIFDDIHWSGNMEKAWKTIVQHKEVTLSVDIFDAGIVFFDKSIKKQHYIINF